MNQELVSVVIPCYNYGEHIEEAIASVLSQTYPHIEIIVVNDGSEDNTEEIVKALINQNPSKIKFISQKNQGVCVARNNGISNANGSYIFPFDADDVMDPEMVEVCYNALIDNNADIVHAGYRRIGAMGGENIGKPLSDNNFLYIAPFGAVALLKQEVWKKTGGYKTNMQNSHEDWELWVNAYKLGFKIHHVPQILFSYRKYEENNRFAEIFKRQGYAKSIIVMNHPELYTKYHVQNAIQTIREEENLADYYFYYDDKVLKDPQKYFDDLGKVLNNEININDKIVKLFDKKVKLFLLDELDEKNSIDVQQSTLGTDFVIFYSNIRYLLPELKNFDLAWKKNKGYIKCKGTVFPFIFKLERENPRSQQLACSRQSNYLNRVVEPENLKFRALIGGQKFQLDKQKNLMQDKDVLLEKRKDLIIAQAESQKSQLDKQKNLMQDKDALLEKRKDLIIAQSAKLYKQEQLRKHIDKIATVSGLKSLIRKYKAYKNIL